METNACIYVSGHNGMVGYHLLQKLKKLGYNNIICKTNGELDLRDQKEVFRFFRDYKPDYVFHLAARVGGIMANIEKPAEFLYDNLLMAANIIEASRINRVKKLLFMGSSCIYPRLCEQPMKESHLLTGSLEPTNEGYALGKISGMKLVEYYNKQYGLNYITIIPPNLYGPKDNFDPDHSHVISALIRKFYMAKTESKESVTMWGTGNARREFMFVEDIADGLIFMIQYYNENSPINIGASNDISIKELALLIQDIVGYKGKIEWDITRPDGMPQKLMDSSRTIALGWKPQHSLKNGLIKTFNWYKENFC